MSVIRDINVISRCWGATVGAVCLLAGLSQPSQAGQTQSHWQTGMTTGEMIFSGTLTVSRPQWVWSGYPQTDVRLVPVLTAQGVSYSLPAATILPVLEGHTEVLFPSGQLTLRPRVTVVPGSETRIPVRGYTAAGHSRPGEMTFRVRQVLACQGREMAISGQGWRLLSDTAAPSGDGSLSAPLVKLVNAQFLRIVDYDYPLRPSGLALPVPSRVMDCQTAGIALPEARQPVIHGEGLAGVSLSIFEDVTFTFRDNAEPVVRWQAGLTPEVNYL
ncbi:hypothetical protein AH810_004778 [Salmonella enterica subsp. enterica]|nr:hypothetical protein [Salmonella enterica subsp. enterica]